MRFLIKVGLLFLSQLMFLQGIGAQISANGQAFTDSTVYPFSKLKDPVFIYNVSCKGGANPFTALTAIAPGNLDSCEFVWSIYDTTTHSFNATIKSESNVSNSILNGMGQGGYQVHITKGLLDTTFRCWIFIHHLSVSVLKGLDGKVLSSKYTCQYVELNATLQTDTFYYYDPDSANSVMLNNNTSYWWSFNNKEGVKDKAFFQLTSRTYNPPVYDTHFYFIALDRFGAGCSDTVLYISIQTRAKFEYKYYDHYGDSTGFIAMNSDGESAPAKFQFINHSINGSTFQWILTDTVFAGDTAHRIVNVHDTIYKPEYTYYIPRQYLAKLISRSAQHCMDTMITDVLIKIRLSQLDSVPNVFTPNGDNLNDYFVFYPYDEGDKNSSTDLKFASIRTFHIAIFDRWGRKVHEFYGDINDWVGSGKTNSHGGWDGKILNTNVEASPGIYFYIMEATGWDNIAYKGRKGFVYLFR
jgi:hypothetical protein